MNTGLQEYDMLANVTVHATYVADASSTMVLWR